MNSIRKEVEEAKEMEEHRDADTKMSANGNLNTKNCTIASICISAWNLNEWNVIVLFALVKRKPKRVLNKRYSFFRQRKKKKNDNNEWSVVSTWRARISKEHGSRLPDGIDSKFIEQEEDGEKGWDWWYLNGAWTKA